ncbi:hypothetical protein Trydic_g12397 [Trypoxylus dichotomus]
MSKLEILLPFLATYNIALATQSLVDSGIYNASSFRILGGKVAPFTAYPYMVSLRWYPNEHFCAGTILNHLWVLTAAHCVVREYSDTVFAVVGTDMLNFGGYAVKVRKIIMHPRYNDTGYESNDIAMIKLRSALKYSATISPVVLGTAVYQSAINVTLIGWGETSNHGPKSNKLRELSTQTISQAACSLYWPYLFTTDLICTKFQSGKGHCKGDSGGPLIRTNSKTQVGVISLHHSRGCGKMFADVFGRVSSYVNWIQHIINLQG